MKDAGGLSFGETDTGGLKVNGRITRRGFLAVSTAGALTAVSARRVHGANETLRLGLIGCGNRGTEIGRAHV